MILFIFFERASLLQAQSEELNFSPLELNTLEHFTSPTPNWTIAGDVLMDLNMSLNVQPKSGTGILVNGSGADNPQDIYTAWEHGDLDIELEFMMANESNSGIYLQGRYEIQLMDSWGVQNPRFSDLGGIYQWWENDKGVGGIAPRLNVARAPGLWQDLSIKFRAPRFNENGEKIAHAKLSEVRLNGVMIHENVTLIHPTGGAISNEEAETGPLRFQGDHGPVAFKNIKYKKYEQPLDNNSELPERYQNSSQMVKIGNEPEVLHGFMKLGDRIFPHSAAVGYPGGINYALDLNSGSLLKIWKGEFINASPMWRGRGGGNLGISEAAITISVSPTVAYLDGENSVWPDSVQQSDNYTFKNFRYEDKGTVVFNYQLGEIAIQDRVAPRNNNRELTRNLRFHSEIPPEGLHVLLASGKSISRVSHGFYEIDDKTYYVSLSDKSGNKARIRSTASGQELVVPVMKANASSLSYSLIW
ncbi:MAG: DUF1080 domain-containing protein [Balneolales bacterium]